ncbi:ribonuclease J1 [Candidatus Xianfuyuplasma coldseepsis]|uniref:Ribonuclease J n=1 Tax=Candidatus Xianfuyuplasma coldseepsis TaxID=2782163 RepID=A0A7L7KRB0_9MOLU|nr:ribonuclease J [Xianfuyuplasma coldseepsis]QMS84338.1 ribonuclease J [Xianfuyuplasma coldseepsis]
MQNNLLKKNEVGVFALGGLGEVGKNMYVVEYQDEILVIDSGILFPEDHLLGIDYVIPDYTYLFENQDKIKALIITHGHEDHIGGIPYLLRQVKVPKIYASGIAVGLIKNKLEKHKGFRVPIIEYQEYEKIVLGKLSISFFRTNHSIPDSYGIAIHTPEGVIVHTGDFKFDFTPTGPDASYHRIADLGRKGVLLLLSDSTNAELTDFTKSESVVSENIKDIFTKIDGRIIVATFASNVHRVQQIVEASVATNRKVAVYGRSMLRTLEVGRDMGYIKAPQGTFIDPHHLKRYPNEQMTIICTGSQGEPMAALSRIAAGTHRQISLQNGDTVIFSSSPIPGNQEGVSKTINMLFRRGANVITNSPLTDTHTSGHAGQEEQKLMLKLIKPKFFMPIHGEYRMLKIHSKIGINTGVRKGNEFVLDNGDVLAVTRRSARVAGKVQAGSVYIDGSGIGDIGSVVIRDRKLLSEDGLLSAIVTVDKETMKLVGQPVITSRGFIYMREHEELTSEMSQLVGTEVQNKLSNSTTINISYLKKTMTRVLSKYIYDKTERNPMIMPVIMIVNN